LDPKTLCVGIDTVKKTLTDRTRAIVVVHIGGLICPDIKDIAQLCEDRGLFLIEDAAHAHGCSIDNQPAGSIGDVGCFSFYPTKIITTGEGGMITTNSDDIAARARILRDQGKASTESNMIVDLGYSWRMQEISAAIGLVQLRRLSEILNLRRDIADYYSREFSKLSRIKPLRTPTNVVNNFYKYVLILSADVNRDELKSRLRDRGVHCGGEVYWPPVHLQPFYQKHLGTRKGDFPDAEDICQRMICPPLPTGMTPEDAKHVVAEFKEALEEV
jgi:dTDP-4-amino-4,6-dideoxygalactose transaminase